MGRPPSSLATVLAMVWWAMVSCMQWHTRSLTPSTLSPTLSATTISPRFPPTPTSTAPTTPPATSPRSPTTALPPTLMLSVLDTEWSATPLPTPLPLDTVLLDTVLSLDMASLDTVSLESNLNLPEVYLCIYVQ